MSVERCVCCGEIIPEGRQYCLNCGDVGGNRKMTNKRKREILSWFREYRRDKRELTDKYNIPTPSGIAYDKSPVTGDKYKNVSETMTIDYISKREYLFKRVYVVEEVLRWFELEGHGRDRFIIVRLINGASIVESMYLCHASERTLWGWQRDVLEKAETVAGLFGV